MSRAGARTWALVGIVGAMLVLVGAYGVTEYRASHRPGPSPRPESAMDAVCAVPHVIFRSTSPGNEFGLVAAVPVSAPDGPRAYTDVQCDMLGANADTVSCLRTVRGVATTYEAELYDASWHSLGSWPILGYPKRTRLTPDSSVVATTALLAGHCNDPATVATATMIRDVATGAEVNLEDYQLVVDGKPETPKDRNYWGVTFVDDDTFYVSAQSVSMGHTWVAKGSVKDRTMTPIYDGGMNPSLSPDGTTLGFMSQRKDDPTTWSLGVIDLATDQARVLGETRKVDDQVEWLDDHTILYNLPRDDQPAVTDVWAIDTAPGAQPRLYIPEAWSAQVLPATC